MSGAADSTAPGYLAAPAATLEGDALVDCLQAWVAGISGLPGNLVRPRWQPNPPAQPEAATDWAAVGITGRSPLYGAAIAPEQPGPAVYLRQEMLDLMVSFYGPHAVENAHALSDGGQIGQNRDALTAEMIGLVEVGRIVEFGELVNTTFIRRADVPITLTRQVRRTANVLDIVAGQAALTSADGFQNTGSTPPLPGN